jgi:hypothetical protein
VALHYQHGVLIVARFSFWHAIAAPFLGAATTLLVLHFAKRNTKKLKNEK